MTVLTLGAHPSLEKTVVISHFEPDRAYRIREAVVTAGSKGFNFARALRTMGRTATVVTPLAGHTGKWVSQLAADEGLNCAGVWIPGETRLVINVVDPATNRCTELIENGPVTGAAEWELIRACVEERLPQADWLVVCGSFLPGAPESGLRQVMNAANAAHAPVILDTYGPPLKLALPLGPALLKINHNEAGDLLERVIRTPAEAIEAAQEITRLGPQAVVITLGAQGAVGVDAAGRTFGWQAPRVNSLCAVGSGDSLLAGLVATWIDGASLKEATRWGIAAGTANTLVIGPGKFEKAQVERLAAQVTAL